MAQFLVQYSYTARSIRGLVDRGDEDHAAQASALVASLGGKVLGYWFALGEFDGVVLIDAPDTTAAAAIGMAVGSTGNVSRLQTTVLLTMDQAHEARRSVERLPRPPHGEDGNP